MSEQWLQASSDIADLSDDELEILIDYTVGMLTDNPEGEPEKLMEALLTETARRRDAPVEEKTDEPA